MDFVVKNWYLFAALFVVLALLAADTLTQFLHGIKKVYVSEAVNIINRESGMVLDICEPKEFQQGHVPNAINIPLSKLAGRITELDKYKNKPVVVSCRSGNRSVKGAVILKKNGFSSVHPLAGGMLAWEKENLPVEK